MANVPTGPYVNVAAFCQQVLQEKDDTITAVRIIDQLTLPPEAVALIEKSHAPVPQQLWLVLLLQPGDVRGAHTLQLHPTTPTGEQPPPLSLPVLFPDGDHGIQIAVNITIAVMHEGTTWFDVYLGEQFLTRMPLRQVFTRQSNTPTTE